MIARLARRGWRILDLKLLRTFTVAARLLNFHQAAQRLYLAQPTVTQHVRLLEEELGSPLFLREGKRLRLTAAGERFLPHARHVLETYESGLQDLASWRQGYSTQLVIATSPLIARSTLPRVLKRFTDENPAVEVTVSVLLSPEVGPAVQSGQAHLGLARIPAHGDVRSTLLYDDPVALVLPKSAGGAGTLPDWREVLAQQLLLTHNHPLYWDDLLLDLRQRGFSLRTMVVTLVDITKRFIEEGFGVSFLPHSSVAQEVADGRLVILPTPGLDLPVAGTYLVRPGNRALPEAADRFAQALQQAFVLGDAGD